MKRLFTLKFPNGQLALEDDRPMWFGDKSSAKKVRNDFAKRGVIYKVSRGPDHDGATKSQHRQTRKKCLRGTRVGSVRISA